jgi:hypothetical protein
MAKEINNNHGTDQEMGGNAVFWGASRLLLLAFISRFHKNFNRYNNKVDRIAVSAADLCRTTHKIIYKQQSVLNLLHGYGQINDISTASALLVLRQQIHNFLDDLHSDILDFDIDQIYPLIPRLDEQREFWNPHHKTKLDLQNLDVIEVAIRQRDMIELQNEIRNLA